MSIAMVGIKITKIIRSKRKTLSLEIGRDASLIVRAPQKASLRFIEKIVFKKRFWIEKKQQNAILKCRKRITKEFVNGEEFLYLGQAYRLTIVNSSTAPLTFNNEFQLARNYLSYGRQIFIKWYKKEAFNKIKERLDRFSYLSGFKYIKFNISNAKRRWGSCSIKGNLYISWPLIMAPLGVIDYVVIHELVHLVEHNHSKQFWNKVQALMPDYKNCKEWLKHNEHLFGF